MSVEHRVDSWMSRDPFVLDVGDTLHLADFLMRTAEVRHLPVVRGQAVVGLLSTRDVLAAQSPARELGPELQERQLHGIEVRRVMSQDPIVTSGNERMAAAATALAFYRISCLPVVDGGRLRGVISLSDFLRYAIWLLERDSGERRPSPTVADLMTQPVATIEADDALNIADAILAHGHFHHLVVTNGDDLLGVISDRDISAALRSSLEHLSPMERLSDEMSILARDVMTRSPITTRPEVDLRTAAKVLLEQKIGALPVVKSGRLVGIVTETDFLSYVATSESRQLAHSR